jgi:hypothetical protein
MRHSQAFVVVLIGLSMAFALAIWLGSLWGALGVLVAGFAIAFVVGMAWLWAPPTPDAGARRPTHDSLDGLP